MARFVGIPSIPFGIDPAVSRTLYSLKENVELLTNQRGEPDLASAALLSGSISTPTAVGRFQGSSARGTSVVVNGVAVPTSADYARLLQDFNTLAIDVANLRETVNLLIAQLRSQQ
ncbi:MAG: hypothetical protein ABFE08_17880 [Armatimonadia bacterium]